jgi:hypothetical protein
MHFPISQILDLVLLAIGGPLERMHQSGTLKGYPAELSTGVRGSEPQVLALSMVVPTILVKMRTAIFLRQNCQDLEAESN